MKTFGIIGAGKVGTTLALLLIKNGLSLQSVYSRTAQSSKRLVELVGAGVVISDLKDTPPVDMLVITTSDSNLLGVVEDIARSTNLEKTTVAFHCSGTLPSTHLEPLQDKGVSIASVHPVKSFTDPLKDAGNFSGTWCGIEGDAGAISVLMPLFESLGAKLFAIDGSRKTIYHAGTVFACNYLAPLMETSLRCYEEAGIDRQTALEILSPILHATIGNILTHGPAKALTGPIARGETGIVQKQLDALRQVDSGYGDLYRLMGSMAVPLAMDKGTITPQMADDLKRALQDPLGTS